MTVGVPGALQELLQLALGDVDRIAAETVRLIRTQDPAYAAVPEQELLGDCRQLTAVALTALVAGRPSPVADAQAVGRRRAAAALPLGALLQAFRTGFDVLWANLLALAEQRDVAAQLALLHATGQVWSVYDAGARAATIAYQDSLVELADRDADRRREALECLLDGRRGDWALRSGSAAVLGLPSGTPWVCLVRVALAEEQGVTLSRQLQAVRYPAAVLRRPDGEWQAVVALGGPRSVDDLLVRLRAAPEGRTGVSGPFDELTDAPAALVEAREALRCLPAGRAGVAQVAEDLLAVLLTHSPRASAAAAAAFLGDLVRDPEAPVLLATLARYVDTGSVAATASALFCHRNTVSRRLRRVEDLTGRRLDAPRGAAELYVATRVHQLLDQPAGPAVVHAHHG